MPENGANVLRLELAASIVSTLPAMPDRPSISAGRWRRWLGASPFTDSTIRFAEDPACNPFTETVVFFGGSYTVLPGSAEGITSQLQMLLRAIFLGDPTVAPLSDEFTQSAQGLVLAALTLGNQCVVKAGLRRDERAETLPTDDIAHPQPERLNQLRDAVTFSTPTPETDLSRLGVDLEALAPLTIDAGSITTSGTDLEALPVYRRPILRINGEHVLVAPTSLAGALTHAILSRASECGDLPAVARRFRATAFLTVDRALDLLGCSRLDGPQVSKDPEFPATRALYSIDRDKTLELLLLLDPLNDFAPAVMHSHWAWPELSHRRASKRSRTPSRVTGSYCGSTRRPATGSVPTPRCMHSIRLMSSLSGGITASRTTCQTKADPQAS